MSELAEEILSYHRDEDYKIVKLREDLISAVRYAFMARRHGKNLTDCEEYARHPGLGDQYDLRPPRRLPSDPPAGLAKGLDFDLFTGR